MNALLNAATFASHSANANSTVSFSVAEAQYYVRGMRRTKGPTEACISLKREHIRRRASIREHEHRCESQRGLSLSIVQDCQLF